MILTQFKDKSAYRLSKTKYTFYASYFLMAILMMCVFQSISTLFPKPFSSKKRIFEVSKSGNMLKASRTSSFPKLDSLHLILQYSSSRNRDDRLDDVFLRTVAANNRVRNSVTNLLSGWSIFADENQFTYLLAHADLFAWHWNRHKVSWNDQISVQVPSLLLSRLKKYHNSMIQYRYTIHFNQKSFQKGIDIEAIFFDTKTGAEIHIYGLYRSDNNNFLETKDGYQYSYDDIFPLRKSQYNGISIWIPNDPSSVLSSEYGSDALSRRYHSVSTTIYICSF